MNTSLLRASTISVALVTFIASVWYGWQKTRSEQLEPSIQGFPKLEVSSHYISPSGSVARRENSELSEESLQDTTNQIVIRLNTALAGRDFKVAEELLTELTGRDPRAALKTILGLPVWAQLRATEVILREWLKTSPDTAWDYIAENNPEFSQSSDFLDSLRANGRFDLGAQAINRMQSLEDRRLAAIGLFKVWAASNPNQFSVWAESLPADIRGMAFAEVAARRLTDGPIDQNWLNATLGQSSADGAAWQTLAERLVSEVGYVRAKEVFSQVTPPVSTASGALGYLARSGPASDAAGWLQQITDPVARTMGTIGAVVTYQNRDPATAAQLSLGSGNQALTDSQLQRIIPIWAAKDPTAVMNFLETSPNISPEIKVKLEALVSPLLPPKK